MHNSNMMLNMAPAATVALVALLAAWPAHAILRRAKRGRARSSIAYLMGFFSGVATTMGLAGMLGSPATEEAPVALAGMLASFVGPVVGMVHAKLHDPVRRRTRRADLGWKEHHEGWRW